MSFLQGATHTTISGGTQIAVAAGGVLHLAHSSKSRKSTAFKDLSEAAAHTALHNSSARYDAPRCHRNTRAKQLDKLELWILGKSDEYAQIRIIWLSGGAGAGKSAIMQSIVERCLPHGVVLGSFFFCRADASRTMAEVLIPTLAYQLARAFPAAMAVLEPIITGHPLIFKASLETQAYELLVRPLIYLKEAGALLKTGAFFVDGLDECNNPRKQALVIETIAAILMEHSLPIVFLVASRPEITIHDQFHRQYGYDPTFATMILDDNDEARADIRQYIEDRFLDIVELHPMRSHITLPWPPKNSIDILVLKSSGHFIYAAIAMNYIASYDEHPVRALEVIGDLASARSESPFAELDALYLHVLTTAKYSAELLNILRHCFYTDFGVGLETLCWVHNISLSEVQLYLSDVQALVGISTVYGDLSIQIKHASLRDFLCQSTRAQHIYVSQGAYCASLLDRLLFLLAHDPKNRTRSYSTWGAGPQWPRRIPTNAVDTLVMTLCDAIYYSVDDHAAEILMRHSLKLIWKSLPSRYEPHMLLSYSCANFMSAIRDSEIGKKNVALYLHHFQTYIQILLDSVDPHKKEALYLDYPPTDMSFWKEHINSRRAADGSVYRRFDVPPGLPPRNYAIIPALIFSSTQSTLRFAHHALSRFSVYFGVNPCYACYLSHLVRPPWRPINPRTMKALRSLPESRRSWGCDLALLMHLALQRLLRESWTPPFYFSNRHEQWIKRQKPGKYVSVGSPVLSSQFYDYRRGCPVTKYNYDLSYDVYIMELWWKKKLGQKKSRIMFRKGYDCVLLLRLVISFLRKADCTLEVVNLARRSLPRVTRWFPKLMKRARWEMDAYVLRWEESSGGLLEKAQSLALNKVD